MAEQMQPLISVIMPAFNVQEYIEEAVESVFQQNYENLELIIVDDASVDATPAIVTALQTAHGSRLRSIRRTVNGGASAARNTALAASQGSFIAFLDSDDVWPPEILNRHAQLLAMHPEFCGVLGLISSFASAFSKAEFSPPFSCPVFSCTLIRRQTLDVVGSLDESLTHGEDTDWFMRVRAAELSLLQSDLVSVYYRRRAGSLTDRAENQNSTLLAVLKKSIDRQRSSSAKEAS
jgi:glycosyltransferase involved in cell wall biosynthesis